MKKKYTAKLLKPLLYSKENESFSLILPCLECGYTTKTLKQQILNMKKTAFVYQTPYLTFNQVGMEQNGIVLADTFTKEKYFDSSFRKFNTYLNPKVTHISPVLQTQEENYEECLSQIGIESKVFRFNQIKIQYMTEDGDTKEEEMSGFKSKIFQQALDAVCGKIPLKWSISKGQNKISERFEKLQNAQLLKEALDKYNNDVLALLSVSNNKYDSLMIKNITNINIPKESMNPRFSAQEKFFDDFEMAIQESIQNLQDELVDFVELNKLPAKRTVIVNP